MGRLHPWTAVVDLRRIDPHRIAEELDDDERLDAVVGPLQKVAGAVLPEGELKATLRGKQLGHPVHPMLTDLPIGLWTSVWLLDLLGGRRSRPAADAFVGLGVLCALPTAAAGLADWTELSHRKQRTGSVHVSANLLATVLYTASFLHRRRGHRIRGVALGMAGAVAATAGGYLGGYLAFGEAASGPAVVPSSADEPRFVPDGPLQRIS